MNTKRTVSERLTTAIERAERAVLIIGAIVLLLWLVHPVRDWMQRQQWMDLEGVVALCALAIMFGLRSIERLNKRVDHFFDAEERSIIRDGTAKVYEALYAAIDRHCDDLIPRLGRDRKSLDVLGITLFSAWHHLQPQLAKKTFRDWDVTFACMSPEFARDEPWVPTEWADEVAGRIRDISEFTRKSKAELKKRNVTLRLFVYDHLPAVHGFRIERDEIFCSYIQWEGEKLAMPFQFYEHFPATNRSVRTLKYRELFTNWLVRAHTRGPYLIDETSNPD